MKSVVGKKLLASAEAFANRTFAALNKLYTETTLGSMAGLEKDAGLSVDARGQVHTGVLMRSTCKWEPFLGATAEKARRAGLAAGRRPETVAVHACYAYTTGRGTKALSQDVPCADAAEKSGSDYHAILQASTQAIGKITGKHSSGRHRFIL